MMRHLFLQAEDATNSFFIIVAVLCIIDVIIWISLDCCE